jgi:predicted O-methyltransferase YrrM
VDEAWRQRLWATIPKRLRPAALRMILRRPGRKRTRRIFQYDRSLLPNAFLAEQEAGVANLEEAVERTGLSLGYPAWNLLYYVLICSIQLKKEVVIVETGTNKGFSTIVLAQALKDVGSPGLIRTVDNDAMAVDQARSNVARAGLAHHVEFHVADSLAYLRELSRLESEIDLALLDSDHSFEHVRTEFEIIRPMVEASHGKVFFDNASSGGVTKALVEIVNTHGGNLIEFDNCSWFPPGVAIWQPHRPSSRQH